jgi:NAD(P)-dependent dehydrogenase (short-subunit alcohol dehydrogenase family)
MKGEESWAGRRVLVTGGASGLGRATVAEFAERGAEVVVLDRDQRGLAELAEMASGDRVITPIICNLADPEDVKHAFSKVGPLDAAANVAAIGHLPLTIENLDLETIDNILTINVRGVMLCMQQELPLIRQRGGGAIVNVASSGGLKGAPGMSAYCASKHAVVGLTRAVAAEVAREGIRVNVICPGLMDTPMFRSSNFTSEQVEQMMRGKPIGRFGRPEEVAEAIVWAAGERSSYMIGATIAVDGGVSAV